MLILHRKTNESILRGDYIRITVIDNSSMGVRLAIDAPKDIRIMREELAIAAKTNEASLLPSISSIHSLQEILEQHRKEVRE